MSRRFDKGITDLAKMFFTELATKDNAVYNHFIDVFSLLTSDQNIDEDSLKRIVKFLTSFIEKVRTTISIPFESNANSIIIRTSMPNN